MLQNVDAVIRRVGTALDDPSLSKYTAAYQMPWIDQVYDDMDVELERAGMQYVDSIVSFQINAGQSDLSSYMADGQPLQYMKFPKRVDWKLPGQEDVLYRKSSLVQELDYVQASNLGAWQWRNANGSIQVTPSVGPIVLNVYMDTMSTNIYDPNQNVIRGIGTPLAWRVASTIINSRGDMTGKRGAYLERMANNSWGNFLQVLTLNKQQKNVSARPIHRRRRNSGFYVPAGPDLVAG